MTLSRLCTDTILSPGHGSNGRITRIVIHRMEAPLRNGTAAAVARYFATGAGGRGVSCHYCVDPAATVGCVHEEQLAYHAPPNPGSLGIEQAGYCATNDWGTPPGRSMFQRTVALTRDLCDRHVLPKVWLSAADLRAGRLGVTSHHMVSVAFGQSSHNDPDPFFPINAFIDAVRGVDAPPHPPEVHPVTGSPRVGLAHTITGAGYWVLFADGGIANYGDAPAYSTHGAQPAGVKAVAVSTNPKTGGLAVLYEDGQIDTRNAPHFGEPTG